MNKTIIYTGILFGLLAVLLGAFGAHGLRPILTADAMHAYETGVQYQMYHALVLMLLGSTDLIPPEGRKGVFYLIALGWVLFSFSLYLLSTQEYTGMNTQGLGFCTPLGGGLLIGGWLLLGYKVYGRRQGQTLKNPG